MKILEISFKNINNLKGDTVISFDTLPLSGAGIFAITGPTGSGKSTILDVITLALFNRIPRFKKAITKSEIEGLGSVMTHHTDHSEANIVYEIRGQQYRSSWTVKKARTGNLKDYEMFLYDSSGTPLDLKKSEVPGKNEAIIGLKYDQFIKSIILSQGQFSKFLKADKNERGQLLENLTGSHVYRKLGAAAYQKHKTVKGEVTLALELLKNIQSLPDEKRAELKSQIQIANDSRAILDQQLLGLIKLKTVKENLNSYRAALVEKKATKDAVDRDLKAFETKRSRLQLHEKLNPLREDLTRYQLNAQQTKQLRQSIGRHQQSVDTARVQHQSAIDEMALLTGQDVNAENFMTIMSTFEKAVNTLDQQLQFIQNKGSEMRSEINRKIPEYKVALDPKSNPRDAIHYLKERKATITTQLESAGMQSDGDLKQSRERLAQMGEEIHVLTQLAHNYEHQNEIAKQDKALNKQLRAANDAIVKTKPLHSKTEQLISVLSDAIVVMQKREEDQKLIASLSDRRAALVDGDACPLCGSLDHPYADHLPSPETDLQSEIGKQQQLLQTQKSDLQQYASQLVSASTTVELTEKRLNVLAVEAKKMDQTIALQKNQLDSKMAVSVEVVQATIESTTAARQRWAEAIDAAEQYRGLGDLLRHFSEMQTVLLDHANTKMRRMDLFAGVDVSATCNQIQNKFAQSANMLASQSAILKTESAQLEKVVAEMTDLGSSLSESVETLGFDTIGSAVSSLMTGEEISQIKQEQDTLTRRSTTIMSEMSTLQTSINSILAEDSSPEVGIDVLLPQIAQKEKERDVHISAVGEKNAILAKDDEEIKRIADKRKEIDELEVKLHKWELLNRMIGNADGSKFANFAQGLTLQNLLSYANRRLDNLTDRYLLDKPQKDGALTVIDKYQGNIHRSVTTLSGGESFLISLALALSLSDMASKNVRLESLFIDEGFGTLDQETLDIAMTTLERLQTESQKTVGVISHVETLKERIHVQIQLDKDALGYSTVAVVG